MSKNAYEVLGVKGVAAMQEIESAFYRLRDQYREEMYQEGARGKAAARKLTEIEQAYSDICAGRATPPESEKKEAPAPIVMASSVNDGVSVANDDTSSANEPNAQTNIASETNAAESDAFALVKKCLDVGDTKGAQEELDRVSERNAEWHYYQAMIYYKKKWVNEAIAQMQMAVGMEPANAHYAGVLQKLQNKANEQKNTQGYNEQTQGTKNNGYNRSYNENDARYAEDSVCRFCETLICVNCLCDCCCRG